MTRAQIFLNTHADICKLVQKLAVNAAELSNEADIIFFQDVEIALILIAKKIAQVRKGES